MLTKSGANVNLLRSQLGDALDRLPKVEGSGGEVHLGNDLGKLLNVADKLAQKRNDQYISSELFVLAALETRSALAAILEQAGAVRGAVENPSMTCVAASRSTTRMPRTRARRLISTRSISRSGPSRANSTRSLVATTRFAEPSRYCSGARRTTRC